MFGKFTPSDVVKAILPTPLRARYTPAILKLDDQFNTLVNGTDERAKSLRIALATFFIRVFSAVIAYVSQILLARWLGLFEYGIYVWVWVAVVICGGLASLGFPSAVTRFVPQYQISDDQRSERGVIFGSRVFSMLLATVIAAVGIAGLLIFDDKISDAFVVPVYLAAICLPMLALSEVQDGIARAYNWVGPALVPTYILRPVLLLVSMLAALGYGFAPTATTTLACAIITTWIASLWQLWSLNRRLRKVLPPGPRNLQLRLWIAVALPIFLVEGFFNLLTNIDILIVGLYLSPQNVAVYFAAVKTLALVHFVYFAVKAAAAHRYARYFVQQDKAEFSNYINGTIHWTFWPSLALSIFLLLGGKYLLMLFGAEFESAYPYLAILTFGLLARAAVGPAESILNMSGQQNACATVYGVTLTINIVLNLTLIPSFGLYGAAWATTMALIFEAAALYFVAYHRLNVKLFVFTRHTTTASQAG